MTERDGSSRDRGDWGADPELRALLRSVDPARSLPPRPADDVSRLVSSTIAADRTDLGGRVNPQDPASAGSGRRRIRLPLLVAAAAVVAVAGVGAVVGGDRSDETTPVAEARAPAAPTSAAPTQAAPTRAAPAPADPSPPPGPTVLQVPELTTARCMVPSVALLESQQVAFEGSVTSVDGDVVTLTPSSVFTGDVSSSVQIQAPGAEMTALLNAVDFEVGKDYLVSASDGHVTLCGYSAETSPELRTLYQQAFTG